MKIVATTSLPAVDRPNADRWNAARSRQLYEYFYITNWHERAAFQRSTAGNDVVATLITSLFFIFSRFFYSPFFFPSVATFSHRRSARIKKLIQRKLLRMPKNLGADTLPDPVALFGAPQQPFLILQAVNECPRRHLDGILLFNFHSKV